MIRPALALACIALCGGNVAPPTSEPTPFVSEKICSETLPVIPEALGHTTRQDGEYLDSTLSALPRRNYVVAAKAYRRFEGYREGGNTFDNPFERFAFRSRWHEAFIGLYQAHFCPSKHEPIDFNPVDTESPIAAMFALALLAAIDGNYGDARARCEAILQSDPNFSYALTILGSIDAVLGDEPGLRRYWLAAAQNHDHSLPMEEIGEFQRVPIELLLHFRP